jgi:hypothetical protein
MATSVHLEQQKACCRPFPIPGPLRAMNPPRLPRQHTAYVSIRQHTGPLRAMNPPRLLRQHTAYVSIQHTSAYVSIR